MLRLFGKNIMYADARIMKIKLILFYLKMYIINKYQTQA